MRDRHGVLVVGVMANGVGDTCKETWESVLVGPVDVGL